MIIAIDGPAASGKGTLGKRLAAHYGLRHLDTGLIYRAVAKALIDADHALDDRDRAVAAARTLDPERFDEAALLRRDARDRSRAAAPLKPAPDAHVLDTTALDVDTAVAAAIEIVERVRGR